MTNLLHSFYCWRAVGVVLLSTVFFSLFGLQNWRILTCLGALIPLYNVYNYMTCLNEAIVEKGKGITKRVI